MNKSIELLAPGGDTDSIKAAIAAGADAVYCGLDNFNARNRATNISFDALNGILRFAHQNNCQVYLTLNIIIVESEIPALISVLNKLANTGIDGIIIQDLGMLYIVSTYFRSLKIHASTQLTTHNEGQILFLSQLSVNRVNLSRELNINEIKALTPIGHQNNVFIEVFVHGSYCICFSGICYMSSVHGGNSGNRGRCSQPCRDQYITTPRGKNFPLNLKDNSAYSDLKELADASVDAIKIEGRIKKFHYVFTVVEAWRKQLQRLYGNGKLIKNNSALYKVFNRDFSDAWLKGAITKDMFIDNPRDHSAIYLSGLYGGSKDENLDKAKGDIYNERTGIISKVENILSHLSVAKAPLIISLSGECGTPLKVSVKTPDTEFVVLSEMNLATVGAQELNDAVVLTRLKALNETEYYIEKLDMSGLQPGVFIPFKELTVLKKRLLFILNGAREFVEPIAVPVIRKQNSVNMKPSLSVLISSQEDVYLTHATSATICFQLPDSIMHDIAVYADLFLKNRELVPWFPSVLIGDDYSAAVELLQRVQPQRIVTNNTGIAYEAFKSGISWIAGPYLNIVNSFSLLCLKEKFNCSGSFISNEISKTQLQRIKKPGEGFELFYSIYHPVVLMTSRQCLFHQVTGCEKDRVDDDCMQYCANTSSITNLKNNTFVIEKSSGNYHRIYQETHLLNPDIVADVPDFFSGFFIDLRDIKTRTTVELDKPGVIRHFENLLHGTADAKKELVKIIHPSSNAQYKKGI